MPKRKGLSDKEQRFVSEYCRDGNATRAAIRAGYSVKTAAQAGYRLVHKSSVAEAIAKGQSRLLQHADMTAEEIMSRLSMLARADMSDVAEWDDDSFRLYPSAETDTRPIKKLSVLKTTSRTRRKDGTETETVTERRSVELNDQRQALKTLAELLGLAPKEGPGGGGAGELWVKTYHPDDWAALDALPK